MLQRFHRYESFALNISYFTLVYMYVYNMLKKLASGKKQFSEK